VPFKILVLELIFVQNAQRGSSVADCRSRADPPLSLQTSVTPSESISEVVSRVRVSVLKMSRIGVCLSWHSAFLSFLPSAVGLAESFAPHSLSLQIFFPASFRPAIAALFFDFPWLFSSRSCPLSPWATEVLSVSA